MISNTSIVGPTVRHYHIDRLNTVIFMWPFPHMTYVPASILHYFVFVSGLNVARENIIFKMGLGLNPSHFIPVRNYIYFHQLLQFYIKNF